MDRKAFLVVGGDSLVGGSLVQALQRRGHRVYASTRRKDTLGNGRVYLDFEDEKSYMVPLDVGCAFIIAAATNNERCETDPLARMINVEFIPKLAGSLLEQGVFVNFISSNSVFGGNRPWPNEAENQAPGYAYAVQKHEAEQTIKAAAQYIDKKGCLSITRLTKILAPATSPLPAWFAAWKRKEAVRPFSDLVFAPISAQFVGKSLAIIGEKRVPGDLHLSGAENVTYVDLAQELATQMGVDFKLISPTTATAQGVEIPFKPRYSGLGMQKTSGLTGIHPQSLKDVVGDLLCEKPSD